MDIFFKNITALYDEKGKQWLEQLPQFIKKMEQELSISVGTPIPNLTFNYVAPATTQDGKKIVFKCAYPNQEFIAETHALLFYNGCGAVNVIDYSLDQRYALLEICNPGTSLSEISNDEEATTIATQSMLKLWKPIKNDSNFKHVSEWLDGLKDIPNHHPTLDNTMVDKAKSLAEELLKSSGEDVLLHGDLHHDNILSAEREPWLVIDPKGVIGEPEYEFAALLRNPMMLILSDINIEEFTQRRLSIISELTGFDKQRIIAWAFVQAVLSVWWCIDDGVGGHEAPLKCIEVFNCLLK